MKTETIKDLQTKLSQVRQCCESGTNAFYGLSQVEKVLTTLVTEIESSLSTSAPTPPAQ